MKKPYTVDILRGLQPYLFSLLCNDPTQNSFNMSDLINAGILGSKVEYRKKLFESKMGIPT